MNAMPGEEVKMEIKVAEGALRRKFYGAIMQDTYLRIVVCRPPGFLSWGGLVYRRLFFFSSSSVCLREQCQ